MLAQDKEVSYEECLTFSTNGTAGKFLNVICLKKTPQGIVGTVNKLINENSSIFIPLQKPELLLPLLRRGSKTKLFIHEKL